MYYVSCVNVELDRSDDVAVNDTHYIHHYRVFVMIVVDRMMSFEMADEISRTLTAILIKANTQ